jgi:hypothetical protein
MITANAVDDVEKFRSYTIAFKTMEPSNRHPVEACPGDSKSGGLGPEALEIPRSAGLDSGIRGCVIKAETVRNYQESWNGTLDAGLRPHKGSDAELEAWDAG